jgi:hypothetical protein
MKKFLDIQGLTLYDQRIKEYVASSNEESINNFKKDYFEPSTETEEITTNVFKPDTIDFAIVDPTTSNVSNISGMVVVGYNTEESVEIDESGSGGGGGNPK